MADNPHLKKLKAVVAKAPTKPGVYRWLNEQEEVLYIGKAKNLRNRMKSYVSPAKDASLGPWKQALVGKIADVDITVTDSELEALILETNLIKELKPKYNVMMKDDKNYVYVRISVQDAYPGIEVVRKMEEDKAKYFGPFLQAYKVKSILDFLQEIYDYRETKEGLSALNAAAKKGEKLAKEMRTLAYQIGQSCGVALGKISREEYLNRIEAIIHFFGGHRSEALQKAMEQMQQAAADKKFEKAANLRDAVQTMQAMDEKQIVSDTSRTNTDVFGIAMRSGKVQVIVLKERDGKLVDELSFALKGEADDPVEVLDQFLPQFYSATEDIPDGIILGESLDEREVLEEWLHQMHGKKVRIHIPERGKKSKLLTMAEHNANEKIAQQFAKWEAEQQNIEQALNELKDALGFSDISKRIEGYDISHLGGTETVGSMVVVKNGKAANAEYRSFTIRSLKEGDIDDYKALHEVLRRRLLHLVHNVKEEEKLWEKKGVTIGKARKAEQAIITEMIETCGERLTADGIDYKDYVVARRDKDIIGFVRLFTHPKGTVELGSLYVLPDERSGGLGSLLCRRILSTLKKGKVYISCRPNMEQFYSDVGFRFVHTAPQEMVEKMECECRGKLKIDDIMLMMCEVSKLKQDSSLSSSPDLLVIDGGKGQLSTIASVLKELSLEIPVIGLAKREEEVFLPGRKDPLIFPKDSQALFLLMRLRDEAHRFANRHREKRGAHKAVKSVLDDVPGIGEKTKKALLDKYGSAAGVARASDSELATLLSEAQVAAFRSHFERGLEAE